MRHLVPERNLRRFTFRSAKEDDRRGYFFQIIGSRVEDLSHLLLAHLIAHLFMRVAFNF